MESSTTSIKDHMNSYVFNEVKHMKSSYEYSDIDKVVDEFKNLRLNDDQYRKLHCWHAKRLGVDRFRGLALEAMRNGKDPARYFTYLLKSTN